MARRTRSSQILEKAQRRAASLKSIDPEMEFDQTRSIKNLMFCIEELSAKLEAYNDALAMLDTAKIEIDKMETELADLIDQMLTGVAFRYGKDSPEVQKAGGTRKSDRVSKSAATRIRNNAQRAASKKAEPELVKN